MDRNNNNNDQQNTFPDLEKFALLMPKNLRGKYRPPNIAIIFYFASSYFIISKIYQVLQLQAGYYIMIWHFPKK